jgi:putative Holliday junction resolvase
MYKYDNVQNAIKGKRILAVDFGLRRVGTAVTDEWHITITPKTVFDYRSESFYDKLTEFIKQDNIGAVVVGIPLSKVDNNAQLIEEIKSFAEKINELTGKDVFFIDESYTSKEAVKTMIEIGKKKKKRATKGETDKIAAALILKEFLSVYDNY